MRSAVSRHSQQSGCFSPASDVVGAACEEVVDPPGLPRPLDFCSRGSSGGTPTRTPWAEAGSWAVLGAESVLAFTVLEGG